jgi:hypothetical protein
VQRLVNGVDIGSGQNGQKQDVGSGDPHRNYKGECEAQADAAACVLRADAQSDPLAGQRAEQGQEAE